MSQLSPFSWVTDKIKVAACFKGAAPAVIQCLVSKGLTKIDSELVKWIAERAGVSDECARALMVSKGWVMSLYTAIVSSACRGHAGLGDAEIGRGNFPQPPPPPATRPETTGGVTHTWMNYTNAGGYQGPTMPSNATVQIACKVTGFRVADGNTWWYRIASAPWNNVYSAFADAFYNNGQTSGSLHGTPFVDYAVPNTHGASGSGPAKVALGWLRTRRGVQRCWV